MSKTNLDYILSPQAVRERCAQIYTLAKEGGTHFKLHENKISECANYVLDVIYENYPNLEIPFHSRWGHFQVGKKQNPQIDRLKTLNHSLNHLSPLDKAKAKWDLVIPSVLLDAGAGMAWKYFDKQYSETYSKSEGLALASLEMYYAGLFANASALSSINEECIEKYFQVSAQNPLLAVSGRVTLMQNLAQVLKKCDSIFKTQRVSDIIDDLLQKNGTTISATQVLRAVLDNLGDIWPGRLSMDGVNLGDVWEYTPTTNAENFLVPFHKLSQWLTYSLLEPLMEANISITDVEKLTGLAEYRNGGLFLDFGVIELKDSNLLNMQHVASSQLIIEWRALTVCLLDSLAKIIQDKLQKPEQEFPLAKILEGGTWWAGRKIAQSKRKDGAPPLQLQSDGTVF
ncbi:MAG: DUF1688 family protein [Bdellovibrionota bacterium]